MPMSFSFPLDLGKMPSLDLQEATVNQASPPHYKIYE